MKWLKGLLINLQFFTSIPIPLALPMDKEHLEKAIKTFPLLGILQGTMYALLLYLIIEWSPFSAMTGALVVWLASIFVTGGIHLDGWMDSSDAFFSYQEQEKRLEIMSDPRSGAFGILSVIVLLAIRFFFIYEVTLMQGPNTYLFIVMIPFFGRMVMGVLLLTVQSAKKEGLGSLFKAAANKRTLYTYPVYLLILIAIGAVFNATTLVGIIIFIGVSWLCLLFIKKKISSWFGGMTGDVLGATVEGTEAILWMTLWLLHYFVMG
jgi:adenosylcobinamide-GDP ribazoletransferase